MCRCTVINYQRRHRTVLIQHFLVLLCNCLESNEVDKIHRQEAEITSELYVAVGSGSVCFLFEYEVSAELNNAGDPSLPIYLKTMK